MARCCVETLQALRENSASVLTIVEVRLLQVLHMAAASDSKMLDNLNH